MKLGGFIKYAMLRFLKVVIASKGVGGVGSIGAIFSWTPEANHRNPSLMMQEVVRRLKTQGVKDIATIELLADVKLC